MGEDIREFWTIEDCDTCGYWNESGYRAGLLQGFRLGLAGDHAEQIRLTAAHSYPRPAVMGCGTAEHTATLRDQSVEIERLKGAVDALKFIVPFIESCPEDCMGGHYEGETGVLLWWYRDEWLSRARTALAANDRPDPPIGEGPYDPANIPPQELLSAPPQS